MKSILLLATIIFSFFSAWSQDWSICAERMKLTSTTGQLDCSFIENEDAYRKIEALMKLAEIPMNFTVCKSVTKKIAYARMDSSGTRFIVYDDAFLRSLDNDSNRLESLTVLAHEIGHHLAAHTLSLNYETYLQDFKKYCLLESLDFNSVRCKDAEAKFLASRRENELEADRFAGFLMNKFGATFQEITRMYFKITSNYDDQKSTHPNLDKRLDAVKAGFELAESKKKANNKKVDLQEIKGSKFDFVVHDLSKIEKNRLLDKIFRTFYDALHYVRENSKINLTVYSGGTFEQEAKSRVINFLGQNPDYLHVENESEYFRAYSVWMQLTYDDKVKYKPIPAIHIKNGTMKFLLFDGSSPPKTVYSAPFKEDQISLAEIRTIFIEIYRNGIQREINNLNEKSIK